MKRLFTLIIALIINISVFSQVEKTIVIEHFTNTHCAICGAKNIPFYSTLDVYPQVLHIAYHPSSPYPNCIFSMHNAFQNDIRTNYYGLYGATPWVVMQGEVIGSQTPLLNPDQIEAELLQSSDYLVQIVQTSSGVDEVNVEMLIKKVSESIREELQFYVVLVEKRVSYAAPNGENLHHDVFRVVLADQAVTLSNIGDSAVISRTYDVHSDWNANQMYAVGMLQRESTKEILQSAASNLLTGPQSIESPELDLSENVLYPNPVTDELFILAGEKDQIESIEIFNVVGLKVKTYDLSSESMSVRDLPNGIYFVVMTSIDNKRAVRRVIKSS